MAPHRSKPPKSRQNSPKGRGSSSSETFHWFGEGADGQQALYLDLDPVLFAIDAELSRLVISAAHNYDGNEEKPYALLFPPEQTIGWQIGYLSKHYNVYLASELDTDGIDKALDYFGAVALPRSIQGQVSHWLDLIVFSFYSWSSLREFLLTASLLAEMLSPDGKALLVLEAVANRNQKEVKFGEELVPIGELFEQAENRSIELTLESTILLADLTSDEQERNQSFVKRNKNFFGKDSLVFLNERLSDREFAGLHLTSSASSALILGIKSINQF